MSSSSSSGIVFKQGTHRLELTKTVVNNACEFPEDCGLMNDNDQKEFFEQFVSDVTKFEEKVNKATKPYYDKSTCKIVEFLKSEKKQRIVSVFSTNLESSGTLKTALVQCNFTDITRLIADLKKKLIYKKYGNEDEVGEEEGEEEGKEEEDESMEMEVDDSEQTSIQPKRVEEIIITEIDPIHTIIDKIDSSKADLCVLIVQQFESLKAKTLDSIISLIFSKESIRRNVSKLRLVVCISTSTSFFTTSCSAETMGYLDLKQFQFTRLDEIFDTIISSNIAPAIFSGEFLNYLRNRFFQCDFSVAAIIKAVQFAFLQKYIDDPFWKMDGNTHRDELKKYEIVSKLFRDEVLERNMKKMQLHIEIQSKADFWDEMEQSEEFRGWRSYLLESTVEELKKMVAVFTNRLAAIDKIWCGDAENLIRQLDEAVIGENEKKNKKDMTESSSIGTPAKTPQKPMKVCEWQRLQKEKKQRMETEKFEKSNTPVMIARKAIVELLTNLFKSVLKPYPASWRNIIGINPSSSPFCHTSVDSNDEFDIESCLLDSKKFAAEPLSVAWRSLLTNKNFKSVPIVEWAEEFVRNSKTAKKHQKEAFFGAAGQLEHMGLIRCGADRKTNNIHVLYHPISHVADI